jgi:hypothetical protein
MSFKNISQERNPNPQIKSASLKMSEFADGAYWGIRLKYLLSGPGATERCRSNGKEGGENFWKFG